MKLPKQWQQCIEVQGECTEKYVLLLKTIMINKFALRSPVYI
jgi:hypothetical protein